MLTDDPVAAAGLVTREVRNGSRDGTPTKIVVARRTYATDRDDLWNALTDPDRLPRWFLPVSGDLRVGGRYQTEGNAGGVIERCDAPDTLAVTWEMGEAVSWLTLNLSPAGGSDDGTVFELVHEAPVIPEFWDEYGPGAVGIGWDLALVGLGVHVDTGEAVDPSEGMAFPLTDAGRTFVASAAADWAEAAVGAGETVEQSRAAAERTVVFYTVDPSTAAPEGE